MDCPHCQSPRISLLQRKTNLGYNMLFRCKLCRRTFNERTSTPVNFIESPTDIIFQVLLCRVGYKLSYRDVAEFFLLRGFQFTHETVRGTQLNKVIGESSTAIIQPWDSVNSKRRRGSVEQSMRLAIF